MSVHLRRISALLVVLLGTVGAPIAMWGISRDLLPNRVPSPAAIWDALTSPDSGGRLLASVMLVGAFLAWVMFTICVLVELGSRISRRPTLRLPGLRVPQTAVAGLISVILASTISVAGATAAHGDALPGLPRDTTVATTTPGPRTIGIEVATAATARPIAAADATREAQASTPVVNTPVWVVQRGDTAWSIAEKALGDPTRWREIITLNEGRPQADGRTLRDGDWLETGWHLLLPAGAAGNIIPPADHTAAPGVRDEYIVKKGDTLSGIARDALCDESRYLEIAAGNNIADPDRIDVGQNLELPAAATPAAASAPTTSGQDTSTDEAPAADPADEVPVGDEVPAADPADEVPVGDEVPAADPADEVPVGDEVPAADPADEVPVGDEAPAADPADEDPAAAEAPAEVPDQSETPEAAAPLVAPPVVPTSAPSAPTSFPTPTPASTPAPNSTMAVDADTDNGSSTPVGVGLSLALAGAAWAALLAARRRQSRRRPAGHIPAVISPAAGKLARRLKEGATLGQVVRMDTALRYAAAAAAQHDATQLPDVTSVWLSAHELQLQLAAPLAAPAPFTAEECSWILPIGAELPDLDWTDPAAPFPALVSLGQADGETLLVDLERVGSLSVQGDPARTRELFNHLAAEFAHNQWCDDLKVTLVGWGADLVALNPSRICHVAGLAEVVADLRGRITETALLQQELNTTVLTDRVTGGDRELEDPWAPEVLLIDADGDTGWDNLTHVLTAITGLGRSTVAVVARHTPGSTEPIAGSAVLTVDVDGTLTLPAVIGDLQVRAAGLNQRAVDELLEVFTATQQFQQPGPAQEQQPWALNMDAVGGLLTPAENETAPATPPTTTAGSVENAPLGGETEPAGDDVTEASGQVVPLRGAEAAAALEQLAAVLAADSALDADVAEWRDPIVRRPRISVLGPAPTVVANGRQPANRITRFTEICVYLAVHPQASAEQFMNDLWAEGLQPSGEARRADISMCRTWLGRDEDGMKYLPDARKKPYELTRLLDLELLKRLRKRADARRRVGDHAGAFADLTEAMKLIRDCPIPALDQATTGSGYSWLDTSDPASLAHAAVAVISAGSELVDLALQTGDLDLAKETAERMHQVDPTALVPLCDLIRTAHQAGDRAAARSHVRRVLVSAELEYIEDLPPEVFDVVNDVFPEGLAV